MNFFCDSRGTIFHVDPEPIYQNSAGANELYFIGAFPSSAQVTVSYKLPNGLYTEPKLMTSVTDSTLDITDQYGKGFSVWKEVLGQSVTTDNAGNIVYGQDYAITENYGKVDVQFVIYASGQGAGRLGTASSSFEVGKGVPIILPDGVENDILAQILVSLQTILQDIENLDSRVSSNELNIIANRERIAISETNIAKNTADISKNTNNITLLAEVQYQSGLQYIQPIEDAYNERVTANGENVLDWQGNGSTARLLKVEGNTQATRNLINPALTTGSVTYAVDGNSIVFTNSKGSPSSFRLYSVKRTKGTYTLSVKDIAGESSRRFLTISKDGVIQQTITTFPAVVTITLDEDAEISLRGEVGIDDYVTTTITELQLVEGAYTEDTMPEYTPYFDGLKSASFRGIVSFPGLATPGGPQISGFGFPEPVECGLGVTIDFENQKVLNFGKTIVLNGTEHIDYYNFRDLGGNGVIFYDVLSENEDFAKGISTRGSVVETAEFLANNIFIGLNNRDVVWVGILDLLGFTETGDYNEWINKFTSYLLENPLSLRYITTTGTETPFTDEQKAVGNEYTAWTDGTETVAGNESALYEIYPTLAQEYVVVTNVKEDTV